MNKTAEGRDWSPDQSPSVRVGRKWSPDHSKKMPKFPEGFHFVTLIINQRTPLFKDERFATIAREVLHFYQERGDYELIGYVIMPDHIHFVCDPIKNISETVRDIKKYIAKKVVEYFTQHDKELLSHFRKAEPAKRRHFYQIWQRDFYDFNIISQKKLNEKIRYMYENPLRQGLSTNVLAYPYSDAHRYFGSGDPNLPAKIEPRLTTNV